MEAAAKDINTVKRTVKCAGLNKGDGNEISEFTFIGHINTIVQVNEIKGVAFGLFVVLLSSIR